MRWIIPLIVILTPITGLNSYQVYDKNENSVTEKPKIEADEVLEVTEDTSYTEDKIKEEIAKYDWDYETAYAVMMAESGGKPDAYNPEAHNGCNGSVGLFQIACVHDDPEKLYDPVYNVQRAYEIWSEKGWKEWGAYTDNRYLSFLQ